MSICTCTYDTGPWRQDVSCVPQPSVAMCLVAGLASCGHGAGRQLQVIQLCVLDALVVQLQPNAVVIQMSRGHRSHFLPVRTVVHNNLEAFFQNTHTCFNKQYYLVILQKSVPWAVMLS